MPASFFARREAQTLGGSGDNGNSSCSSPIPARRPCAPRRRGGMASRSFSARAVHVRTQSQARRPRLFRRPRHVHHPEMAADDLRREVVTFTADLGQGEELEPARKKAEMMGIKPENIFIEDVREEFVRDFVFPMFRANAALRGPVPAWHLDRAAADRQASGRDRPQNRRRRGRAWRDRQGQRSGALRTVGLCARPRHQDHRAVARMGVRLAQRADRLRRAAPDPDRQGQARRSAVLDRRQPAARLFGRQSAGRPGARRRRLTSIRAPSIPRIAPDKPTDRRDRFREGRSRRDRRQDD